MQGSEDPVHYHSELVAENDRLKESIKFITNKCIAYNEEIQSLLRKIVQLTEEKIKRLEMELKLVANMDSIQSM